MAFPRRWLLILSALVLGGGPLFAATKEQKAYAAAVAAFQDEIWSRADTQFAQFMQKYPKSTNAPEAVLLRAQAEFKQNQFTNAIALLDRHKSAAGALADQYVYWIGEAQFRNGEFTNAAETWIGLAQKFPESQSRLRAVVEAAAALGQIANWSQVDDLLSNTNGVFERAAQLDPGNELVVDGRLSLEKAKYQQRDFPSVVAVYELLTNQWQTLSQVQQCQSIYLFYQATMELGDFTAALAAATNLVQIASSPTNQEWLAAGWASRGAVLERIGRLPEAKEAWQHNLTNAPVWQQREAILKIAELEIVQGQLTNAEETLTNFLAQFTNAVSADIALLTVGELRLKEYAAQPAATNHLQAATAAFNQFLGTFTNSPFTGKAYLNRGWCGWFAKDMTNSLADFQKAGKLLPPSEDLAVARFKAGDAMFALTNCAGALENYRAVLDDFTNFPTVTGALGDRALYQILRANLGLTNMDGASNAVVQILKQYPAGDLALSSALLYGEGLVDMRQPAAAREQFQSFETQFPDTPLRPRVEFAIARTYGLEQNWPAAIAGYQAWLEHFPANDLRSQTFYALAWATSQAGNETNAFELFTNFVAQFPASDLAPQAQWWVADHFYRLGGANSANYVDAERNYELVYQNFSTNVLAWRARLMAGRAAVARQGYSNAIDYFKTLETDTNCPMDLRVQAAFAHGNALMQMDSAETNNPLANFSTATNVFASIVRSNPTNEAAACAWGKIGECEIQLALYDAATNHYAQVLNTNVQANTSLRSQAQIGIGIALEKIAATLTGTDQTAVLREARDHYYDVFKANNLRVDQHEQPDPFWQKKAGLEAARLEESLQEWPQALHFYRDLTNAWPSLQAVLENKIEKINREHPDAGKN
jgi:TolA-binding protein